MSEVARADAAGEIKPETTRTLKRALIALAATALIVASWRAAEIRPLALLEADSIA